MVEQTRRALKAGALHSIPSRCRYIEDEGVSFALRILPALALKRAQGQSKGQDGQHRNPFLPPQEELVVAGVSATHLAVLNKFNLLDHHLLIVTRHFEKQESWLGVADFEAMWRCMAEFEGLAFYNAGRIAGASQGHKHLQIVPLPLAPQGAAIPIQPLLDAADADGPIPGFAAHHKFARLPPDGLESPSRAARLTRHIYRSMATELSVEPHRYNLLASRAWMLMVPRSKGMFGPVSVNALGFAGSLVVQDDDEFEFVRRTGPWKILQAVSDRAGER